MPNNLANSISIPYYQLIGSPIVAMIQAEALAAQASAEFIETVGFVKNNANQVEFGKLKTITFNFKKQNVNGSEDDCEVTVPLLSILPIPLLQIKDATIEFNLKLTDVTQIKPVKERRVISPNKSFRGDNLIFLKGIYGTTYLKEKNTKTDIDMKVKINISQSDIPVGLSKLFQIFDIAISSKQIIP